METNEYHRASKAETVPSYGKSASLNGGNLVNLYLLTFDSVVCL